MVELLVLLFVVLGLFVFGLFFVGWGGSSDDAGDNWFWAFGDGVVGNVVVANIVDVVIIVGVVDNKNVVEVITIIFFDVGISCR